MKITDTLTDRAVLAELGERIARRRLDMQLTQAEVAEQAGIGKRTLERIESGESAQMSSMIRLLRVLDLLGGLDHLLPEAGPTPMDWLKRRGKVRQRASARRTVPKAQKPWIWGEDL